MSTITAPFRWLGRVFLWIVFFPLGIWRSVVNNRRKRDRRRERFEADQREKDRRAELG